MTVDRVAPGPGQESVWDYPRPPRLERAERLVRVELAGRLVATSRRAHRVLETSQPPAYYLDPADVHMDLLVPSTHHTYCEWKGLASYYDVVTPGGRADQAAWTYLDPTPGFEAIRGHVAFYAQQLECYLDDERVAANAGTFYGGWITHDIVGPFKGGAGTAHW